MHDITARRPRADRAAAVPCRRAQHPDHAGAAAGRDRHAACPLCAGRDAGGDRARAADAARAGARDHPGADRASALGDDGSRQPARGDHRLDAGAATPGRRDSPRAACRCCRSTARPKPARSRSTPASAAISSRAGSTGLPGLCCEARIVDDDGQRGAAGHAGEVVVRGPNVFFEYWGNRRPRRSAARGLVF